MYVASATAGGAPVEEIAPVARSAKATKAAAAPTDTAAGEAEGTGDGDGDGSAEAVPEEEGL